MFNICFNVAKWIIAVFSVSLTLSAFGLAQGIDQLKTRAESGDDKAQYDLAVAYYKGNGVPQNYMQAFRWFDSAARKGNADAQFSLGVMFLNGQGVAHHEYSQAAIWFRKAAEQGHVKAQFNLGLMYSKGEGVTKDYTSALDWLRKASDQGYVDAQAKIKFVEDAQRAAKAKEQAAAKAKEQAAAKGDKQVANAPNDSTFSFKPCYEVGLGADDASDRAYDRMIEHAKRVRNRGDESFWVGISHLCGSKARYNPTLAKRNLDLAIHEGYGRASFVLASMYIFGIGTPRDFYQAYAHLAVATCTYGKVVPQDGLVLPPSGPPGFQMAGLPKHMNQSEKSRALQLIHRLDKAGCRIHPMVVGDILNQKK